MKTILSAIILMAAITMILFFVGSFVAVSLDVLGGWSYGLRGLIAIVWCLALCGTIGAALDMED